MTPITHLWLRSRGFRFDSHHVDVRPHMVRVLDTFDRALEISESYYPSGGWTIWLRSDVAHSKCRFVFLRNVETCEQLERLWLAIMDKPLAEEVFDESSFPGSLEAEQRECERRYLEYAKSERYGYVPG